MGCAYDEGQGVERDLVQARAWALLAAEGEDEDAPDFLEELAGKMTADQIADAERLAEEWRTEIEAGE